MGERFSRTVAAAISRHCLFVQSCDWCPWWVSSHLRVCEQHNKAVAGTSCSCERPGRYHRVQSWAWTGRSRLGDSLKLDSARFCSSLALSASTRSSSSLPLTFIILASRTSCLHEGLKSPGLPFSIIPATHPSNGLHISSSNRPSSPNPISKSVATEAERIW
jgi:hypothetical protein